MKRAVKYIVVFLFLFVIAGQTSAVEGKTDWNAFSKNLSNCLCTCNLGVKLAALQHIITYSDSLDMNEAVFDIVCLYRNHENEKVKQLALTALYKIEDEWAMDFLSRHYKYEESEILKSQIRHMIYEYRAKNDQRKKVDTDIYLAGPAE